MVFVFCKHGQCHRRPTIAITTSSPLNVSRCRKLAARFPISLDHCGGAGHLANHLATRRFTNLNGSMFATCGGT
jgi:hypothetical protein